jgi:hypothetical protein
MNASPSRELDSDEPKQASSVATPVAVPSLGGSSDSQPLTLSYPIWGQHETVSISRLGGSRWRLR